MKRLLFCFFLSMVAANVFACTGITLRTSQGSTVVARTIEWGDSYLDGHYVVVPRGYTQRAMLPDGSKGMKFSAEYGYVGLTAQMDENVVEGFNEAGLSAGLFFFPRYGKYTGYADSIKNSCLIDIQLVSYILGKCRTIADVKSAVTSIHVIGFSDAAPTSHWRFTDASGKQVVLEYKNGEAYFYDNDLGILTNSPDFLWHVNNLNNYVNLYPGAADPNELGNIKLTQFGAGGKMLGLPGDITPPSRFVRAAFFTHTSPVPQTTAKAVTQAFHILNNFDIPIGLEFAKGQAVPDMQSATQWTSATDIDNRVIYFRTMYNSNIRAIDLGEIDFKKVKFLSVAMDATKEQPIEWIVVSD